MIFIPKLTPLPPIARIVFDLTCLGNWVFIEFDFGGVIFLGFKSGYLGKNQFGPVFKGLDTLLGVSFEPYVFASHFLCFIAWQFLAQSISS